VCAAELGLLPVFIGKWITRLVLSFFQKNNKAGRRFSCFQCKTTKLAADFLVFDAKQQSWPQIFLFSMQNNKVGRRFSCFQCKTTKLVADFPVFNAKQQSWSQIFLFSMQNNKAGRRFSCFLCETRKLVVDSPHSFEWNPD